MPTQALQQIYSKLRQSEQALGLAVASYKRLSKTPLFDPIFYSELYADVNESGLEPLAHYVLFGSAEARQPHPLFDCSFYLQQLGPQANRVKNLLVHYLNVGHNKDLSPYPLFDAHYYAKQCMVSDTTALEHYVLHGPTQYTNPHPLFDTYHYVHWCVDVDFSKINPLTHFCYLGAYEGREPHPLFHLRRYLHQLDLPEIRPTELRQDIPDFTRKFYRQVLELRRAQPDLVNPLIHFLKFGVPESRSPHPLFSVPYYLQNNPDVVANGLNPLVHYLQHGQAEHRDPHRLFNTKYYLSKFQAPVLETVRKEPLNYFLFRNSRSEISPHPDFDLAFYSAQNPDVAFHKVNPLEIYIRACERGGRPLPNKWLDAEFYASFYEDVVPSGLSVLEHYLVYGEPQGRSRNLFDRASKLGWTHDFDTQPIEATAIKFSLAPGRPAVSIILFGTADLDILLRCLSSLAKQTAGQSVQIIAQACSSEEKGLLDRFPMLVLDEFSNQSVSSTCNRAAERADAPVLVFLNKNAYPINDWYVSLTSSVGDGTQDSIVGSSLLTPLGRVKNRGCAVSEVGTIIHKSEHAVGLDPSFDTLEQVDFCERHALAVRRDLFNKLSGFDSSIASTVFEDADFAERAKQFDVGTFCQSRSKVVLLNQFPSESEEHWPLSEFDLQARDLFLKRWR